MICTSERFAYVNFLHPREDLESWDGRFSILQEITFSAWPILCDCHEYPVSSFDVALRSAILALAHLEKDNRASSAFHRKQASSAIANGIDTQHGPEYFFLTYICLVSCPKPNLLI